MRTFFEWSKSDKLKIDNNNVTLEVLNYKLQEETTEVIEQAEIAAKKNTIWEWIFLVQEILDVIQVLLIYLKFIKKQRKEQDDYDYIEDMAFREHEMKRRARKWEVGTQYVVERFESENC